MNGINDGPAPENYTDNLLGLILDAEEDERQHKADLDQSIIDTAQILAEMQEQMEQEQKARKDSEKRSAWREWTAMIIGGLTLGATILFGVLALLR